MAFLLLVAAILATFSAASYFLTTASACDLSLGSATVKRYGFDDASVTSHAKPLGWWSLPWTCERTKRFMRTQVFEGKISIPKCISSVRRKCTDAHPTVFAPCLEKACAPKTVNSDQTAATNQHSNQEQHVSIEISSLRQTTMGIAAAFTIMVLGVCVALWWRVRAVDRKCDGPVIPLE